MNRNPNTEETRRRMEEVRRTHAEKQKGTIRMKFDRARGWYRETLHKLLQETEPSDIEDKTKINNELACLMNASVERNTIPEFGETLYPSRQGRRNWDMPPTRYPNLQTTRRRWDKNAWQLGTTLASGTKVIPGTDFEEQVDLTISPSTTITTSPSEESEEEQLFKIESGSVPGPEEEVEFFDAQSGPEEGTPRGGRRIRQKRRGSAKRHKKGQTKRRRRRNNRKSRKM